MKSGQDTNTFSRCPNEWLSMLVDLNRTFTRYRIANIKSCVSLLMI
nr:MAG TPA: hypothetical protein [Caudoviricetes sp.]